VNQPTVTCHILDTGYCLAHESLVMRGGKHRQIQCHSLVALIKHPSHGWGLWDTGYAPRMLAATERWPFNLYRRATPMFVRHDLTVATQLARFQLDPTDIHWVVLSHMHADHLAGLRDFPHAQVYLSRSAYESVRGLQGIAAVRRAFIPSLMPSNLDKHLNLIDQWDGPEIPELGPSHDLSIIADCAIARAWSWADWHVVANRATAHFAGSRCRMGFAIHPREPFAQSSYLLLYR
jgi:hypothetical protein